MLIAFLVVFIVMIIIGIFFIREESGFLGSEGKFVGGMFLNIFGWLGCLIVTICICVGINKLQDISLANQKIQVCEEENARIEAQVEVTVNQYLEYEQGVFDKIDISEYQGDRLIFISQLYPDLKANTLLQQQLDMYVRNNNEIRKLKLDKVKNSKWKFWLYFGNIGG